jgi:hypothetical protein
MTNAYKFSIFTKPNTVLDIGRKIDERLDDMFKDGASVWAYEGRNGGHWVFDEDTQRSLVVAEEAGKHTLETVLCGHNVVIDMHTGVQENSATHKMRRVYKITSDTPGVKGVAGMPSTRARGGVVAS